MNATPDSIDLVWLTQRCLSLQVGLTKPVRSDLRAQHQARAAADNAAADTGRERIATLLAAMGQPRCPARTDGGLVPVRYRLLCPEHGGAVFLNIENLLRWQHQARHSNQIPCY